MKHLLRLLPFFCASLLLVFAACDSGGGTDSEPEPREIEATVEGTVSETSGDAVGGAEVSIFRGSVDGEQVANGQTEPDGGYEITFTVEETNTPQDVAVQASAESFVLRQKTVAFSEILSVNLELPNFEGGAGTESDPYEIATAEQLQEVTEFPESHYVQVQDIDASVTENWNDGRGFISIGKGGDPFTGSFEGNAQSITGLTVDLTSLNEEEVPDTVGIFGVVEDGTIENVKSTEMTFRGASSSAPMGMLVAYNDGGEIQNVEVEGEVSKIPFQSGGLVGFNDGGVIEESVSSGSFGEPGDIPRNARGNVGGLVGQQGDGTVRSSESAVDLYGVESTSGGLVGSNGVGPDGRYAPSTIVNSSASGTVVGKTQIGGLVGESREGSEIIDSRATGNVTAVGEQGDAGGLVGYNEGVMRRCSASGNVSVTGESADPTGGLVGTNSGEISESEASGDVSAPDDEVGGLVGANVGGEVRRSKATGSVEATVGEASENSGRAGGLVGSLSREEALISKSYATGSVETSSNSHVAGSLVGRGFEGEVVESYATGSVLGEAHFAGGVVGVGKSEAIQISMTFWDVQTSGQDKAAGNFSADGATSLTTDEIQGDSAEQNMDSFDFEETWQVVTGDYPALSWEDI